MVMYSEAWRTLMVNAAAKLYIADGQLVAVTDGEKRIVPLDQLARIVIDGTEGSISLPLLSELSKRQISTVFSDCRHRPTAELLPIGTTHHTAGHMMDQAGWEPRRKDMLWKQIVRMKIKQQIYLSEKIGQSGNQLRKYRSEVRSADESNREAMAAKVYFSMLFGADFKRGEDDAINVALNYGYAILCSACGRALCMHGYHPALGIHHRSRVNSMNLACDIMEPFRPFVDAIVVRNLERELNKEYREELNRILYQSCVLDSHRISIMDAIEELSLDVCRFMNRKISKIREVEFESKNGDFSNV